jgi:hypothetical protein
MPEDAQWSLFSPFSVNLSMDIRAGSAISKEFHVPSPQYNVQRFVQLVVDNIQEKEELRLIKPGRAEAEGSVK